MPLWYLYPDIITRMEDCIFCNIGQHRQKSEMLLETEELYVIRDIMPKAPVHLLVIPKQHIVSVNDLSDDHRDLISSLFFASKKVAAEQGIAQKGYKLVINVGREGGQVIPHLHIHLLGGKQLEE